MEKQKKLSFRPKTPEFDKKAIAIFKISTFEFPKMQSFMLKEEKINLGPKLPGLEFQKTRISYLKSASSNLS